MKYIHKFTDRHGHVRHYFRKRDLCAPLPGPPESARFLKEYFRLLEQTNALAAKEKEAKLVARRLNGDAPKIGVYLLIYRDELTYIGSSLNMLKRVKDHQQNGRPFDRAFYIATRADERNLLEALLIKALNPAQNRMYRAKPERGEANRSEARATRPLVS